MNFVIKKTKHKEISLYKSLYLKEEIAKKIDNLAEENNTSFNNIVVSMIEYCLNEIDDFNETNNINY